MKIKTLHAKDIMRAEVIRVYGSMTLKELARLLEAERITGAPVVEDDGRLIGVVSETDLVRFEANHKENHPTEKHAVHSYFKESEDSEAAGEASDEIRRALGEPDERTVEEIMTPWTVSVYEDTPIVNVARTMTKQRIHRVFVTDRAACLKGIITTMDLVALLANERI